MGQYSKALLHKQFLNGLNQSDFATDWEQLSSSEQDVIADFISALSQPNDLPGYNKESWTDGRTGKEVTGGEYYKRAGAWHYHSGPYGIPGTAGTPPHLPRNLDGSQSRECIHYFKINPTKLIVFGYSKRHTPFLNAVQYPRMKGHSFEPALKNRYDAEEP